MADFPLPPEVLASHIAILGKTGSGKSHTARLIVEHVIAQGARVCILDPIKSDWWGLTSSADGKRPGLPFHILGGPRGHVPLHSSAGTAIGEIIGRGWLPLSIVDMADFEAGGIQRFFVDFAQALWRNMCGVVYLVVEEAHEMAPKERAGFGAENMAIHWAKKLAVGGRSKGVRLIVATQSVQQLHNRVLGSCETLIAHRFTTPADQEPVLKWLKANAEKSVGDAIAASLSSLRTGSGWVCSGEAKMFSLVDFPRISTFDNTATPDHLSTERQVTTAPVDQEKLRTIIGTAVEEAKANDPVELKKRIRELERQIDARGAGADQADRVAALERQVEDLKVGWDREKDDNARLAAGLDAVADIARRRLDELARPAEPEVPPVPLPRERAAPPTDPQDAPGAAPAPRQAQGNGALPGPSQRILNALAWWSSIGIEAPTRLQIAVVAEYSPRGGAFLNPLGALRSDGLVTYPAPDRVSLTKSGQLIAKWPDSTPSTRELHGRIMAILDRPKRKILEVVLGAYPRSLSRKEVAERAGYAERGGAFMNPLGNLRSLGFVNYEPAGHVAASPLLFIEQGNSRLRR